LTTLILNSVKSCELSDNHVVQTIMKYKLVSKKPLIISLTVAVLVVGGIFGWKKYRAWRMNDQNISLADAAKVGEMATHKLMVQIENKNCPLELQSGCYERGDIVLIKDGQWEFSDAEKSGFLILHMDITDKQTEVLVRSIEKTSGKKSKEGEPNMETVKMRKYAVDFQKIGIAGDDEKGREMGDKTWKWDVVKEK
jgi:hypothetical protein